MDKMLVSAVVSAYNSEKFIRGRLENLVEQTLYRQGELEIIVIDSNSSENEGEIVKEFASAYEHISYHRTDQRETVYGAWNRGIKLSCGRYFINANTDDRFSVDGLEKLALALEADAGFAAAYGDWYYTFTENDSFSSSTHKEFHSYPDFYPPLLFYHQLTSHALMIRREVFQEIGFFDDSMEVCGDRDWVFRLALAGFKVCHLGLPVGLYLQREDSLERSKKDIAATEFSHLFQAWQMPEKIGALYGVDEVPGEKELADLYARTATLGLQFLTTSEGQGGAEKIGLPSQSNIFFRRALALDPDNFMARHNLALSAALQGAGDYAIGELKLLAEQPVRLESEKAMIANNLKFIGVGGSNYRLLKWIK